MSTTPPPAPEKLEFSEDDLLKFPFVKALKEGLDAVQAEQYSERKTNFLKGAVAEHKILPADYDKWATRYDKDPDLAKEIVAELPVLEVYSEGEEGSAGDGHSQDDDLTDKILKFQEEHPGTNFEAAYQAIRKEVK